MKIGKGDPRIQGEPATATSTTTNATWPDLESKQTCQRVKQTNRQYT